MITQTTKAVVYCYELRTSNGSVFFRNEKERQTFLKTHYAFTDSWCLKPYECKKWDRTWWFYEVEWKNGEVIKRRVHWEYVK